MKSKIQNWIIRRFKGYCPTSEEIENSEIKSLANQLKAESLENTLANVLEWQERNITFWTERHPIHSVLPELCKMFAGLFIATSVLFFFNFISPFSYAIALIVLISSGVSSAITTLVIMVVILHYNRKIPWKEIRESMNNIFAISISMNFLLEKKLGVCRDYAKLTACLLMNIYPDAEIYFASAPNHVATGIKVNNNLYMLDQRLPILTKNCWNKYRKPKKSAKIEKLELGKNVCLCKKATFPENNQNLEAIPNRITQLLNIKENPTNEKNTFQKQIPWKKGNILYEDDKIVNYSLTRLLKAKISNEMLDVSQIAKITVTSDEKDKDLIFIVDFYK